MGSGFFLSLLLLSGACQNTPSKPSDQVLARVGDRVITVDDFVRRAEYTIRPPYCKSDSYIHKKIILNSLIAEKLFALEADTNNQLYRNQEFQHYIQGRREQAMRQEHLNKFGFSRVKLKEKEIEQYFRSADRKYQIRFVVLSDKSRSDKLTADLRDKKYTLADLAQVAAFRKLPDEKELGFFDDMDPAAHQNLFATPLREKQVIGPLKTIDNQYLVMEVNGWTDRLNLSDQAQNKQWNDVRDRVLEYRAQSKYREYVGRLMKGKEVRFNKTTFQQLAEILRPIYIKTPAEKKDLLNAAVWNKETPDTAMENVSAKIEKLKDQPFYTIDGKTWTVADFEEALQSHPLVFRQQKIEAADFPRQFQLAVVDLIRDQYITADAYKKRLDRTPDVQRYTQMWADNLVALYYKQNYLSSVGLPVGFGADPVAAIEHHLNPLVDNLQAKYAPEIAIDMGAFEKIQLTRIDLVAIQNNMPYPIVEPHFPLITTDHLLDYGRRLDRTK